jgi:hypothetical protein
MEILITEKISLNKLLGDIFRKITVRALGTQLQHIEIVETGVTDRADFIVIRCSGTNNFLPSNNN